MGKSHLAPDATTEDERPFYALRVSSTNVQVLQKIYNAHIVAGMAIALCLLARPQIMDVDSVLPTESTDKENSHYIVYRSMSCLIFGLSLVMKSFVSNEQVRFHKSMGCALLVVHASGVIVLSASFVALLISERPKRGSEWRLWVNQLVGGICLHGVFLIAIMIRPGIKWLLKSVTHQYVSFEDLGPHRLIPSSRSSAPSITRTNHATTHSEPVLATRPRTSSTKKVSIDQHAVNCMQSAIEKCLQTQDVDSRVEAIQELWDQVDKDQNGVLSPSECLEFLREHVALQRNSMINAMRITKQLVDQFTSPFVKAEACRLAGISLAAFDEQMHKFEQCSEAHVRGVMEKMDLDGDGQVDRDEFVSSVFETVLQPAFVPAASHSQCPVQ